MLLYLMCVIILLFLIFSLIITKDIFSPPSIICESYLIAILCTIYNVKLWDFELHLNTFFIMLLGLLSFIIPSFLMVKQKSIKNTNIDKNTISLIKYPKSTMMLLNVIAFIIFVIYMFYFFKAIGSFSNFTEFSQKMEIYRENTQFLGVEYIPTLVNFFSKFCRAFAYINIYILINNILYCKFYKIKINNIFNNLFSIILYIPLTLTSGARFDLIIFFISSLIMFAILYKKIYCKNLNIKKVIKITLLIFVILLFFSQSRTLVGRTSKSDTMTYITNYFGGGIACFDMYMQDTKVKTDILGQELFFGINKFLGQLNIISVNNESDSMKFRISNSGVLIGNIYTGFRKMHHDFGVAGILFFQIILALIFNKLYYSILNKEILKSDLSLKILIYSSIIYCLVLHSFSEFFYSSVLSFNYLAIFIMMIFIKFVLKKVRIR